MYNLRGFDSLIELKAILKYLIFFRRAFHHFTIVRFTPLSNQINFTKKKLFSNRNTDEIALRGLLKKD